MILLSNKFPAIKWSPSKDDNEWINNERVWILFQNSTERIAICSVYMACESPTNNDFKTWNDMIYAELSKESRILENDGYNCVIVGDFNAHVGVPPQGIDGNRAGVNYNARKLLNFIDTNNLVMVNKDKNLCTGTFTRITLHLSSILDYLLVSKCMIKSVLRMGIDSDVELLPGSDHVTIRFDLSITGNLNTKKAEYNGIFLSDRRDMKIAQKEMNQMMDKIEWDNLSLIEWGEVMQNILINANVDSYNTGPRKKN